MKANELRPMRTRQSACVVRAGDFEAVPPYLQRYVDEYEAWHARRRPAPGPTR
jgi:hypothetical protein